MTQTINDVLCAVAAHSGVDIAAMRQRCYAQNHVSRGIVWEDVIREDIP
jgi:hypothetical protein